MLQHPITLSQGMAVTGTAFALATNAGTALPSEDLPPHAIGQLIAVVQVAANTVFQAKLQVVYPDLRTEDIPGSALDATGGTVVQTLAAVSAKFPLAKVLAGGKYPIVWPMVRVTGGTTQLVRLTLAISKLTR